MRRRHVQKSKINNPSRVLVSSDIRPSKKLDVLKLDSAPHFVLEDFSLRDIKMAARKAFTLVKREVVSHACADALSARHALLPHHRGKGTRDES